MAEEDLDLTKTCPLCASPNVSSNAKGQIICRDCGNIAPAGKVVSEGIFSRIKGIFRVKKGKKKAKKIKKTKKKGQKRLGGIRSIFKKNRKTQGKKRTKKKAIKKKKIVKRKKRRKR